MPVCEENGVEYTELLIATDALTVAVNPDLEIDCLTVDQLITLFGPGSKATNWQDIDPSFPDEAITGFIPGTDSGTYDYMASEVVDPTPRSRHCAATSRPRRTTTSWSTASPAPRARSGSSATPTTRRTPTS